MSIVTFSKTKHKHMDQTFETTPEPGRVRNTFLTVLCILTFIGSGWGLYKAVTGYFTADTTAAVVTETRSKVEEQMDGKEQPAFVKGIMSSTFSSLSADNIRTNSLISLLSCALTLAGAIMMWNLRKPGFYLYIAGTVISIVAPIMMFGGGLVGLMSGGFTAVVGIAFIVMYGVNTKYMA